MGLVGNDLFSDFLLQDLVSNNVKIDFVKRVEGKNTSIIAFINGAGERTFFSYRGVNGSVNYKGLKKGFTKQFDCVHISGYCMQDFYSKRTAMKLIEDANLNKVMLTLDPSFFFSISDIGNDENLISHFNIVIPNKDEAELMTNQKNVYDAARSIRQMGPQIVVIKMAKDGCLLSYEKTEQHIPAYPLDRVINTIGAGDAFCSGFLSGVLNGASPGYSAKMGNAAAHLVLLGEGGHSNLPTIEKIKNLIQKYDGIDQSSDYTLHQAKYTE